MLEILFCCMTIQTIYDDDSIKVLQTVRSGNDADDILP